MKYNISIEEILCRVVEIEADSVDEAIEIAEQMYDNEDIVLDADDFISTIFDVA